MLTPDEDRDISDLAADGWSISAIASHLGHDGKTIRAHLSGDRLPGQRRSVRADDFEPFVAYIRARLEDHPDLPARTLYQELVAQGFNLSYATLTARVHSLGLRPTPAQAITLAGTTTADGVDMQDVRSNRAHTLAMSSWSSPMARLSSRPAPHERYSPSLLKAAERHDPNSPALHNPPNNWPTSLSAAARPPYVSEGGHDSLAHVAFTTEFAVGSGRPRQRPGV